MEKIEGKMEWLFNDPKPAAVGTFGFLFSWLEFDPTVMMPFVQLIIGVLTIVYLVITIYKKLKR